MSADVCGCGDGSCRRCFPAADVPPGYDAYADDDGPMAYECDVCGSIFCDGEECVEDEPQGGYPRDDDD